VVVVNCKAVPLQQRNSLRRRILNERGQQRPCDGSFYASFHGPWPILLGSFLRRPAALAL
jgi:hypothetical protein